jgi:hypothetical protein
LNLRQFGPCASAGNNRQSDAEASGPVPVPADRDRRLHESTPSAGHRFTSRYHAPAEVFCGALEVLLNKAAETESIQIKAPSYNLKVPSQSATISLFRSYGPFVLVLR